MMMRKLLVLMLVLGIAPVAYAGNVWFEVDASDATSGDYLKDVAITINVVADMACTSLSIGAVGAASGAASAPMVVNAKLSLLPLPGTIVNSGGILIEYLGGSVPFGGANPAAGEVLYNFEYTPDTLGPVTIDDILVGGDPPYMTQVMFDDYTMDMDAGALNLNIIPEPATIALLGLGGLALLRRRK
jgi:hypothetical protein